MEGQGHTKLQKSELFIKSIKELTPYKEVMSQVHTYTNTC